VAATETATETPAARRVPTPAVSCFYCGRASARLVRIRHEASGSATPVVICVYCQGPERARPA
jgi:hypothetical protein